jgi:hypothetical protein
VVESSVWGGCSCFFNGADASLQQRQWMVGNGAGVTRYWPPAPPGDGGPEVHFSKFPQHG